MNSKLQREKLPVITIPFSSSAFSPLYIFLSFNKHGKISSSKLKVFCRSTILLSHDEHTALCMTKNNVLQQLIFVERAEPGAGGC